MIGGEYSSERRERGGGRKGLTIGIGLIFA